MNKLFSILFCVLSFVVAGYAQTRHEQTISVNGVSFNMIFVEGGTFMMGATPKDLGSYTDSYAQPVHRVTLSSYYIGETEVTQDLWQAVMGSNPSNFTDKNCPVEQVKWNDCQTFIQRLNSLTGKNFRLPTEAEWEFAARGGNKSKGYRYSGSNTLSDVAWFANNADGETHPVKTKLPNELGLYDMSGNVLEWCQDWIGDYSSSPQTNPTGASDGRLHVYRGGSMCASAFHCRVSSRCRADYLCDLYISSFLGLRLALTEPISLQHTKPIVHTVNANGVKFQMIFVKGGTFTMGETSEQAGEADDNEMPAHQVTLSSYYLGETEVTQALWEAVMGEAPSFFKDRNHPVEMVNWEECQTFITKLNVLTGKKFRLPTEAEWEFAARGGIYSLGYKYSGSNEIDSIAWYWRNGDDETHPVKTKLPNELGIYDMSGNVSEWCQNWYDVYDSSPQTNPSSPQTNPFGPRSGGRVVRGGDWEDKAGACRVSNRGFESPYFRIGSIGLRLAM